MAHTEAAKGEAAKDVTNVHEKMLQLQKERDQARADKKVLVKEIKALWSAQPEKDKELASAKQAKLELEVCFILLPLIAIYVAKPFPILDGNVVVWIRFTDCVFVSGCRISCTRRDRTKNEAERQERNSCMRWRL